MASSWRIAKDGLTDTRKAEKALQADLDVVLEQLQHARHGRKREPLYVAKPARASKENFTRVVIPDSHGSHISRPATAAFLADLKRINPDEVVMLGDHLDCGGFLAQHHTMGFVAETDTSYEEDVACTNEFLDLIQKNAPRASITYLEGNHEARVEKWCVTQALRNKRDAKFLLDVFGPRAVLRLDQRGIKYYHTSGRYHGLPVPGTIKLGQCHFTHGISYSTHATYVHAQRFGASVVHGHTHRASGVVIRTVGGGVIGAWCPGTLAQLQPLYMNVNPTNWSHGYGLQLVAKSGRFMHINVPIIGGQSLLEQFNMESSHGSKTK